MSIDLLELMKTLGCCNPHNSWLPDSCLIDEKGIRAESIDNQTETILTDQEWLVRKQFEKDIQLDLPCAMREVIDWVQRNDFTDMIDCTGFGLPAQTITSGQKPWLTEDVNDPKPEQPWYTPARYFARQLIKEDSTLLTKRDLLVSKVSKQLKAAGIMKRGGKVSPSPETVKKALVKVNLT